MPEDVKLPGLGSMDKKKAALLIGGVLVVGIAYYRHKQAAGSSSAASATANPTDPATGYPQGSPEDLNALALQGTNPTGAGGGGGGIVDPNGQNNPNQTTSFVDNAHWKQAADSYLAGLGESPIAVSDALGKYLSGTPVTPAERSYIDQATASQGQPPVAGPNGYPPFIHMVTAPATKTKLRAPSIRTVSHNRTLWRIGWAAVPGADHYEIHQAVPVGYSVVGTTRGLSFDFHRNGRYWVYAYPASSDAAHRYSDASNAITVTGVK